MIQSIPTLRRYDPKPDVTTTVEKVDNNEAKNVPITNETDAIGYCNISGLFANSQTSVVDIKEMNPPRIL